MSQVISASHPRVWIGADEGPQGFNLSIPEAQHLAGLLTRLTELIGAGIVRPPDEPGDITDLPPAQPTPGNPSVSDVLAQMRQEGY